MFFKYILLCIIGGSAGFITAAAFVAFVAMLGVFPKIAAKTKTASECMLYENCLIIGILLATLLQFFIAFDSAGIVEGSLPPKIISFIILSIIGLFGGIYTGFLIGGLSEVLNVIPIYARIAHLKNKLSLIIFFLAMGKGIFTLIQFILIER